MKFGFRFLATVLLSGLLSQGAGAATNPAMDNALQAAENLRGAIAAMDGAKTKAERIESLTATINAYEHGLSALRDGLRRLAIREAEIKQSFDGKRDEIGRLLGVMTTMQQTDGRCFCYTRQDRWAPRGRG
ncbi:hypothetical protein [Thioclava sp. GXIMD2076]|uniref:hypothetical protein n=1 Tax=Thioclava sp. GXIMD2076 TaxID=3131931 RepID=UPI0030D30DCA